MKPPSIRRALMIRGGIVVGVLLCCLSVAVYLQVRHSLFRELDTSLTRTAALLAEQVEYEGDRITFEWGEGLGSNELLPKAGLFQYWDHRTGATTRSPALGVHDLPRFTGPGGQPLVRDIVLDDGRRGRAIGLLVYPFVLPEETARMRERGTFIEPRSQPHTLVVAHSAEHLNHTLESVQLILSGGLLLTLGLGFLVIDRAVRAALRPLDGLAAEMAARTENRLDAPLEIASPLPTELAALADNFDLLLSRVAGIRQRERDFIRHAAHELRTPVATLRATTDLALSQPREAAAYAAHLAACQKAAIELGELVSRLSALARLGQADSPVVLRPVDAKAVLSRCMERFLPLFNESGHEVKLELPAEPMAANSDSTLLRIVFNNLLDNAAAYASTAGEVRIRGEVAHGWVTIRFSNKTVGPPGNPDRFFEPLFRKDHSRNAAGHHLGIGLTLAHAAATSMGATLHASVTDEDRIEFALSVPPARAAERNGKTGSLTGFSSAAC